MMTIVLADDHPVVRKGLRALLEAEADFAVIGEAADGLAVVGLVERLKPQVLIVDLMMPGLNGLEVVRQVKQRVAPTQVIVLSMHSNEAYVLEALRNGAAGYVLKDASPTEFMQAVREVGAGRHYLSSVLSERAIEAYIQKSRTSSSDQYETLTTREREVLHLVAQGAKNSDIADRLSISVRTAETHRTNLMRKLSLHTQADLRQYALQRGLIPLWE